MTSRPANTPSTRTRRAPVQLAALVFGIVFVLVGILGFIPGVTTNYDALLFAGNDSGALLLGVFQVSILHNIVHLLFGVAGIVLSRKFSGARNFLIWGGVIYFVLWIYGLFVAGMDTAANIVPLNNADNWLHLVLAIAMVALGLLLGRREATTRR
ncbi:DUF4383 domain-containing protein [Mycetocola miduiensis]|uniref:DUF4383 domain-containing protein n=1 Tax=Mycetocola miduiensis TaxID=995034 RepID=A0A1I5AGJ2_9MICO|nr:DUF4383 domain-containing protein [Mycetocola miduiensis]SFN61547.1 protein of unknown function [Mycetocola miduiensis]